MAFSASTRWQRTKRSTRFYRKNTPHRKEIEILSSFLKVRFFQFLVYSLIMKSPKQPRPRPFNRWGVKGVIPFGKVYLACLEKMGSSMVGDFFPKLLAVLRTRGWSTIFSENRVSFGKTDLPCLEYRTRFPPKVAYHRTIQLAQFCQINAAEPVYSKKRPNTQKF